MTATTANSVERPLREGGVTAIELVVVLVLAAIVATVALVASQGVLGRESARGAVYAIQGMAQRARVEAASRNRDCRLLVNTATRRVLVMDTAGTVTTADDLELAGTRLSSRVQFRTPDGSPAVTLEDLGGGWFGATFDANGIVASGTGSVVVRGQDFHSRLTLFAAGGRETTSWNGSAWSRAVY